MDSIDRNVCSFLAILDGSKEVAVAAAAIQVLTRMIEQIHSETVMELHEELRLVSEGLQSPSELSLKTVCDLFLRNIARAENVSDINRVKLEFIQMGHAFEKKSMDARKTVCRNGLRLLQDGLKILVHGSSRVVIAALKEAKNAGMNVAVFVTEGRPKSTGAEVVQLLNGASIQAELISESGIEVVMHDMDCVLVGARGITENGGLINQIGTHMIAVVAKSHGKPFYVATETYKFSRLFPLSHEDVPHVTSPVDFDAFQPSKTIYNVEAADYTPPNLINLLITDAGNLKTEAVRQELDKMYMNEQF